MRHYNPIQMFAYGHHTGSAITEPYQQNYKFSKPSSKCRYVQVVQYIATHPGCMRRDILGEVFNRDANARDPLTGRFECRGHQSNLFSNLLYADLIDYDSKYRYHVTPKGKKLLKDAYRNDVRNHLKKSK